MKVYVAGASIERETRAIPAIAALREAGIAITHDWTVDMQQFSNAENSDANIPDDIRLRCALLDDNGVRQADFVLLLAPTERGSSGAWVELGLAIARGIPVVVAGAARKRTIFTSLAKVFFATDQDAVAYLTTMHLRDAVR